MTGGDAGAPRGFIGAALIDWGLATVLVVCFSIIAVLVVLLPTVMGLGTMATEQAVLDALQHELLPELVQAGIAAMLLAAFVLWAIRRNTLRGPAPRMGAANAYGFAVLAGLALQLAAQTLQWGLSQTGSELTPTNAEPITALARKTPWIAGFTVVVLAPLAEELLFRHVLLRRFMLANRAMLGLVLTSVVFALLHEPFPDQQSVAAWLGSLALYTGMGMAFGAVYLRTGRLGATFLAHAVCNLVAMSLMAYSAS